MIKDGYDLAEAAHYAGFETPWMVDYLCRHGIVTPTKRSGKGRGRPRLFSFSDLVMLRAIKEILSKGISVKKLTKDFRKNKKNFSKITENSNPFRFLITDGSRLYLEDDDGGIKMIAEPRQYCFRFVVDIHAARARVTEKIDEGSIVKSVKSFRKTKRR